MQKSLIIIHSDGPVASTSLAGLCEHLGYCFLPLRKIYLEEYISGTIPFYSDKIRHRIVDVLLSLSTPRQTGGVSVAHRDQLSPITLTKLPVEHEIRSFLSYKPKDLEDQIFSCLEFVSRALVYKSQSSSLGFIVLSLPRPHLSQSLFLECCSASPFIRTFVITRPYVDWAISLLSQEDSKKSIFKLTRLSCLYKRHLLSLSLQHRYSELPIKTSDVLLPNTISLFQKLSTVLGIIGPPAYLPNSTFDLYGRLLDFKTAFTPSGDSATVSNYISRSFISYFSCSPLIPHLISDSLFVLFRSIRLFCFK